MRNVKIHPGHTLIFNKPYGVLSCFTDTSQRPTLSDYISVPDVYAAGRLDFDSEGLLLLTSDGSLAHRLTDPKFKLCKTYVVQVERIPDEHSLAKLRTGVVIGGRKTRPAGVQVLDHAPSLWERPVPIRFRKSVPTAWLEISIAEGMNRQVRRMTAAVGHPALRIIRMAIGPIRIDNLLSGQYRQLRSQELRELLEACDLVETSSHLRSYPKRP